MPKGGSTPRKMGRYTNVLQVQGAAGNKTEQYLATFKPEDKGQQGFWREALTDIPHPLEKGKTMTYGQYQDYMAGPNRGAALDAYGKSIRSQSAVAPEAYGQAMFDQAKQRMLERGRMSPGSVAFPQAAMDAYNLPISQRNLRMGNAMQSSIPGQVTNPQIAADDLKRRAEDDPTVGQGLASSNGGIIAAPTTSQPVPMQAKKMMPLAKYKDGTKKVKAKGDREMAAPSVQSPEDKIAALDTAAPGQDMQTSEDYAVGQQASRKMAGTMPTPARKPPSPFSYVEDSGTSEGKLLSAPAQVAATAPQKAAPKNYQEAAKHIREDKALYAQYRAGVASGKQFSLAIGGKEFTYAATPKGNAPTKKQTSTMSGTMSGLQDAYGKDVAAAKKPQKQPIYRTKAQTDEAWMDYALVDESMLGYPATGGKKPAAKGSNAKAESMATPDDTADNTAIARQNRRKMKSK